MLGVYIPIDPEQCRYNPKKGYRIYYLVKLHGNAYIAIYVRCLHV